MAGRRLRASKAGLPPGTLTHVGERRLPKPLVRYIDYTPSEFQKKDGCSLEEALALRDRDSITWVNVDGLHDLELVRRLGEHYGLHPLVVEDIPNTDQRPKQEDHEDYVYVAVKMLQRDTQGLIQAEHISLAFGTNWVLSFQEGVGDVWDPVRKRLQSGDARARKLGADYLAYRLLDAIVDHYFVIMEAMGDRVDLLEGKLTGAPNQGHVHEIHRLKNDLIYLRRAVWPLREVVNALERSESPLIAKETKPYLRDIYDHTIQVIETLETYRDVASGMLDLYMSTLSHRMNEVMKALTIIATIFIPLSFIAGIWGMNFRVMPEIDEPWGYPAALGLMAAVAAAFLVYFRRKRWI